MLYSKQLGDQYQSLWDTMQIKPQHLLAAQTIASKILTYRDKYETVEHATTVPWPFTAVIHSRESDLNFKCHLHNGDPLRARTVHEPKGRPVNGNPPFTWEESAEDALRQRSLSLAGSWDIPHYLFRLEGFNGWGYRNRLLPSPYLFSFSNHYAQGKFVSDHQFDPHTVDQQCGAAVLLRVLFDQHAFAFPLSK